MNIASGKIEYLLGTDPVTGRGFSWTEEELESALSGPVSAILFDHSGKADISSLLSGLPDTDFEKSQIERILKRERAPENWRVGEALAETKDDLVKYLGYRAKSATWERQF